MVQRQVIKRVSLGPIPLELQSVPYSLLETQGVGKTYYFIITSWGTEVGGRQQRLCDSSVGGFCLNFSPVGRFGVGLFCPVPSCPGAPKDGGSGYLPWCRVVSALVPRCPLQHRAMPLRHQHSPPKGLLMHGSGLGFPISSEQCWAQRILDFLFRETAAMSVFPHVGQLAEVLVRLPALRELLYRQPRDSPSMWEYWVHMEMSTHQQRKPGGVTPEPSLVAGPCSPRPTLAHGRASTSITARVRKQERCPWWVPGFVHCPAAVGPFGACGVQR